MEKTLILLWFFMLNGLNLGTLLIPENAAFWLASTAEPIMWLRMILSGLLLTLLFTYRPRRMLLRIVSGLTAASVLSWAVASFLSFDLLLLDTLGFIGASCLIGVIVMERKTIAARQT